MNDLFVFVNIITLIAIVAMCIVIYINRKSPGAIPLLWTFIFVAIVLIASSLELWMESFEAKVFWRNAEQIGGIGAAVSLMWLAWDYSGSKQRFYKYFLIGSALVAVINVVLIYTDSYHHIMRDSLSMITEHGSLALKVSSTTVGMLFVYMRFVWYLIGVVSLYWHLAKTFKQNRKALIMVIAGQAVALILSSLRIFSDIMVIPNATLLIIPLFFMSAGLIRFNFFSLSPIAKDWVFDTLKEGLIIYSNDLEVVEANPSGRSFLNKVGKLEFDSKKDSTTLNFVIEEENTGVKKEYYVIDIQSLYSKREHKQGFVAVIKDVTDREIKHQELLKKSELDSQTLILNKASFTSKVEENICDYSVLFIIDIDYFKKVNDSYGHSLGDEVILKVVEALKESIRQDDLLGRFGGDEFCIYMNSSTLDLAYKVTERIISNFKKNMEELPVIKETITLSIGGAFVEKNDRVSFNTLFDVADKTLYMVKEKGRNACIIKSI